MRRPSAMLVGIVALGMMASGCYGPFTLTRKVWKWNGEVSDNKWAVEAVFLICYIIPVYGIAGLADAVIFNSVVFWTGNNMLETAKDGVATKRIVRGDTETVLSRVGDDLGMTQYRHGKEVASLTMHREGDGMAAYDANGVKLFSASTRPDGTTVVADARGRQVASYSAEQAQRMLETARR